MKRRVEDSFDLLHVWYARVYNGGTDGGYHMLSQLQSL